MARRAAQRAEDETLVDEHDPEGQSSRTGVITEDEHALELSRSVAKRMGWTPREDWKRDPAKWVDAPDFLEQTPRELESLKERLKRTGQAAEAAMAEAQRQAQADAEARVRAAVEAKDPDEVSKGQPRPCQNLGTASTDRCMDGTNPWFETDQDAQVLAVAEIDRCSLQMAHPRARISSRRPSRKSDCASLSISTRQHEASGKRTEGK